MPVIEMKCDKCGNEEPVYVPQRGDLPGPCGERPKTVKEITACSHCGTEMKVKGKEV